MARTRSRRLRFESLEHRNLLAADIAYVRHFDTWNGAIRSTDPAGITYHAPSGRMYLVDSEIDELPEYFVGNNIFEVSTRGDTVYRQIASKNSEPTGITYNAFDGFFYVTNDDSHKINRYDSRLNAPLASIDTRSSTPNAADPEDITSDPATGMLYVVDGHGGGKQVLVYTSALVFQSRFYIGDRAADGEGIAFDPASKTLFIVSTPNMAIFEYTTTGQYLQTFDISSFVPRPVAPQALAIAPTSDPTDSPNAMALYIADAMVDNFADGRVYETVINRWDPNIKSLESRVATGSDDAEERASGTVVLTSADLELVYDGSNQTVGMRFTGINIPRGAAIVDAHIQFQADVATSEATSLRVQGQAIDNAPTFVATTRDVSSRARTSASVDWVPPAWPIPGAAGRDQQTPNLAPILQQIIDRPGWLPGNALALLVSGTGLRAAEAFEGGAARAPLLRVQYRTDIAPPNTPPIVNAGPDLTGPMATPINLDGTVTDDGRPTNTLTTTWSQLSGPATVVFGNASSVDTTATFPQFGTYTLQLAASDGVLSASDSITVQVTGKTVDIRVATGSDDAEEKSSGSVNLTSSDLELVFDAEYQANQTVGMRFNGLNIPRNATILDAYVQFQVDEAFSDWTSLLIQGENSDTAATFAALARNISARPRTTESVAWSPAAWPTVGLAGPAQQTPNLATIIQQIVARTGWLAGNSLALLVTGTGTRTAEAYEGKPTAAPLLHVEYLDPVTTTTQSTMSTAKTSTSSQTTTTSATSLVIAPTSPAKTASASSQASSVSKSTSKSSDSIPTWVASNTSSTKSTTPVQKSTMPKTPPHCDTSDLLEKSKTK